MIEKRIREGICYAIQRYAKANNKYMKNYVKNIKSSYLMYLEANNLYGRAMSQRLPASSFELMEQLFDFDVRFVKNYDKNNDVEVDVEYPKFYLMFILIYHFYLKERTFKNARNFFVTYITKKTML